VVSFVPIKYRELSLLAAADADKCNTTEQHENKEGKKVED
jgi:hypothetical protein